MAKLSVIPQCRQFLADVVDTLLLCQGNQNQTKTNSAPATLCIRESERTSLQVRKNGIVAVTSRFAAPWNTRTRWSCFSDCEWVLVQAGKRHDDWDPIPTFAVNAGEGGAVAEAMLVWRVAMSSVGRCGPALRCTRGVCARSIGVCSVRTDG